MQLVIREATLGIQGFLSLVLMLSHCATYLMMAYNRLAWNSLSYLSLDTRLLSHSFCVSLHNFSLLHNVRFLLGVFVLSK